MRALQVRELLPGHGGAGLADLPIPAPGPGEVRVRVRAAGVNFPDLLMTSGGYQLKPELPFVSGLEFAGEVDAVGKGVADWNAGDAVVGGNRFGAMAEYAVVPAGALRAKPGGLSWEEAAAYPVAYLTAYVALVRCARIEPGEWLLVHGAAGGVGLATVDLAKALGARVIAAASSAEKREAIARLYAPDAVIAAEPGFRDGVKALTEGKGAAVIFDPVGGDVFDESTRWRTKGRSGRTSMPRSTLPTGAKALRCSSGARRWGRSCCGRDALSDEIILRHRAVMSALGCPANSPCEEDMT